MDSALKTKSSGETVMSQSLRLGAIGQISRGVSDIDRAVEWYGEALGLPHLYTFGDLAFFDCGGIRLFLTASDEGRQAPGESVIYFQVEDIHAAYAELRERGIEFSGAPHMVHRHENGVEEWMAFFPDPEGNLLALIAHTD
ncbi:glyoxalase [Myceligenerans halotolerans]